MKVLGTLVALILLISTATANYPANYVNSEGYTWRGDGYWYYNNVPYTQTQQLYYYYQYGCRYQAYKNVYTQYYPPLPTYKDPDWKSKLLEIAKNRDLFEGNMRKEALESALFLQAVDALGLRENFRWQNYGQSVNYPQYSNYTAPVVQGSTAYVQSYSTIGSLYGSTDLNVLYQQASKLAQNSQQLAGQATVDFSDLIGKESNRQSRLAEILAKGEAVERVMKALEGNSAHFEQKSFAFKFTNDGKLEQIPIPQGNGSSAQAVINRRCIMCHKGPKAKGSLDLTEYEQFTPEQKDLVWERLITTDTTKMMPRAEGGGPGERLKGDELKPFSQ